MEWFVIPHGEFNKVLLALIPGMTHLCLLAGRPALSDPGQEVLHSPFLHLFTSIWLLRSVWVTNVGAFCTVGRTGVKSTISEVSSALGVSLPTLTYNLLKNLTECFTFQLSVLLHQSSCLASICWRNGVSVGIALCSQHTGGTCGVRKLPVSCHFTLLFPPQEGYQ